LLFNYHVCTEHGLFYWLSFHFFAKEILNHSQLVRWICILHFPMIFQWRGNPRDIVGARFWRRVHIFSSILGSKPLSLDLEELLPHLPSIQKASVRQGVWILSSHRWLSHGSTIHGGVDIPVVRLILGVIFNMILASHGGHFTVFHFQWGPWLAIPRPA